MFRAAANGPFDDVVAKATDENLTSEDWAAIIGVCDRVTSDANGPKEAVQSLIKRLAHRNANVQLYTLELAHALCQNCGKNMHREVSSRAFTEALLKLANDRITHPQVKAKILERMKDWSDMFSSDPELGIMYDAYYRLKQNHPNLQAAPSAPQKQGLTDVDRQKEEDELQMALRLSLQDEERKKATPTGPAGSQGGPGGSGGRQDEATPPPAPVAGTTAATVSRVRALFDFTPSEPGELEFKRGDVIAVLESVYKDWWRGSLRGKTGIFPLNYVEKLADPTADELQREAQMEAEVFAEIKNVEKLLTLLSASNTAPREEDNEEISKLYHQTLAIRPKLIKLIEKYSQKKDDFTQLNEKFIKARRDYEALLESSMSHPPQHNYPQYPMPGMPPSQGYPPAGAGYPPVQQQDAQRYYTPGSQGGGDGTQYQTSSPPPNFPPQGQGTPAPFYVAGAEIPGQHGQQQHPGNQGPPPQQQQQQHQQQQQQHQYPPREHSPRVPSGGNAPAPIDTSPSLQGYAPSYPQQSQPPPAQTSGAYAGPQGQQAPPPLQTGQRPPSTYGAQELATSVYDSPIAPHNPQSAATYSSSVYSQDDYGSNAAPPPGPYQQQLPQHQQYGSPPPLDHQGGAPPVPTGQPPAPPAGGMDGGMAPPPLHPAGTAYDARQGLPSQGHHPQQQQQQQHAPQYRPYVPPGAPPADGPSAPPPSDYYHQSGGVY